MKHGRFETLNLLDKTLFRGIFTGIRMCRPQATRPYALDAGSTRRILVIRPGGFGDLLLALPMFRLLKEKFPSATIDLACMHRNIDLAKVVDDELGLTRILLLDRDIIRLLRGKYDLAISLDQSQYQYIVPTLMGVLSARIKIGYDIGRRSRFCTHRVVYRHDEHEAQCCVNALRFFGIEHQVADDELLLETLPELRAQAIALVEKNDLESGNFVACSFGGLNPQNKLPDQTVRAVISLLHQNPKLKLVALGATADFAETERLCSGFDERVMNLCGKTSLRETLGLLGHAGVYFGYDGGPLHMAVAAGCKTVSVWGPSLFDKWAPRFSSRHSFIKKQLACQPCLNGRFPRFSGCPFGMECLSNLAAEDIVEKIQQQWVSE